MGIIVAIIIFGIIVTVHEFGHFICAKLSGIKVIEFSVGMGPKLLQKKKGETAYSLRLLPVGGYCAMEEDIESDDSRNFRKAKLWKRVIVLAAGAFNNFVLGFIMIAILICTLSGVPTNTVSGFVGVRNDDGTATYYAESYNTGLRKHDKIVRMDGTRVYSNLDINFLLASGKDTFDLVVVRDGEKVELPNVRFHDNYYKEVEGTDSGGVYDFGLVYNKKNPLTVIKGSGDIFMSMSHIVGLSLKQLVSGEVSKDDVSGPVGVVSAISETTAQSKGLLDTISSIAYMTALITINIGIMNLLPIPGLDGGRLLFCLIEFVRRKPVKPEHEGYVHLAGMVLLFGIMIFATYNDIVRLVTGG